MIDFVTVLAGMYGYRIPKAAGDHRDQRTLKESRIVLPIGSVTYVRIGSLDESRVT